MATFERWRVGGLHILSWDRPQVRILPLRCWKLVARFARDAILTLSAVVLVRYWVVFLNQVRNFLAILLWSTGKYYACVARLSNVLQFLTWLARVWENKHKRRSLTDPCESQPHKGHLTSKLNCKTVPFLPSLDSSFYLPWCTRPDFPSVSSSSSLSFLYSCHGTKTTFWPQVNLT